MNLRPLALLAALALLSSPPQAAQAQATASAPGPQRSRAFAQLAPRLAAVPRQSSAGLQLQVPTDRPHLYYSAPLSALLGLGGMLVGYGAGLTAFGCEDESPGCDSGPDDFEYTLAFSGLALGAATGAHLGGRTHASKGNFLATLGGAAVGALPLLLMRKDDDQTGMWVAGMVGAPAGAVLADYLVRSPRS